MGGLTGAPAGGASGGVELEYVGRLTGLFLAVLEALSVHMEITALVLGTAAGETLETHHNHLGGGHMLTSVASDFVIVGLRWWLRTVVCHVVWRMVIKLQSAWKWLL